MRYINFRQDGESQNKAGREGKGVRAEHEKCAGEYIMRWDLLGIFGSQVGVCGDTRYSQSATIV
jgi:hypothetical protein